MNMIAIIGDISVITKTDNEDVQEKNKTET